MSRSPIPLLAAALALVIAACASGSPPVDPPPAVVEDWLVALDGSDFDTATARTFQPAFAMVIAVENGLSTEETSAMLTSGVPASVAASYWSSFRAGFGDFAGFPLSELEVGVAEELHTAGVRFAAVEVSDGGDGDGAIFTRDDPARQVDLVATLAPGFVEALLRVFEALPATADGDVVRSAYEDTVVPAMWAAIASERYDDAFVVRAMGLIDAVAPTTTPSP
jgi:hypothetical protein